MNTTHTLSHGTESLSFTPAANGTVVVDHRYPNGLPGPCYRPGVATMGKVMSLAAARTRYAAALASGWVKVAS